MKEQIQIDYNAIRERIFALKKSAKLSNYEFCKIYAPEKCTSKTLADNYISALSTGRGYPDERHGKLLPDLSHMQNLVNSELFPHVTLNYLVYGDEEPSKIVEKIDFDLKHWTHADFCEFLWTLKVKYPKSITIQDNFRSATVVHEELPFPEPEDAQYRSITITIEEVNQIDYCPERIFSLGQAVSSFHEEMKGVEDNRDEDIRNYAFKKAVKKIRNRSVIKNPFLDDISNCEKDTPFGIYYGE